MRIKFTAGLWLASIAFCAWGWQISPQPAAADGSTPLHNAVYRDDFKQAEALLRAGANAKAATRYGVTPLSLACTNGNAAMVELLLNAGADANSALPGGETTLMTAARTGNEDTVAALLRHGANVNAKDAWRGQTALMWAAAEGHAAAVKVLLDHGADMHMRSQGAPARVNPATGVVTIEDNAPTASIAVAASIATAATGGKAPESGKPAAETRPAAGRGAGRATSSDFTPFLFAVRGGHVDVVKVLLAAGADPNETLGDGTSALVLATTNARYELGAMLLDKGANANADKQGWTALHQVAWTRRPNIHKTPAAIPSGNMDSLTFVKVLVAHGANPNARETKEPRDGNLGKLRRIGATPYLLAAKSADTELMRCLVVNGADPTLMTAEKVTPLEAASGVGVYRVSESPGSNEDAMEAVLLAYELGSREINWVDDNGNTAMHGAAMRGANSIVQFLFDKGAKLDVVNKIGWTPLTIAEGVFYPDVFKTEAQTEALLLKLGAKKRVVPDEVRYAGMDKDGRETTVGGGGDGAPAAKPKVDAAKPPESKN
jgi:ankyrin repeat protein